MNALEPIASRKHTVILLVIFAAVSILGYSSSGKGATPNFQRIPLYVSVVVSQWFLLRFVFAGVKRSGHSLAVEAALRGGWRDWALDLLLAVVLALVARGVVLAMRQLVGPYDDHSSMLLPHGAAEHILWVVVALTAGICEELIFRGYLQRQFSAFLRNRWLGVVVQAVIFGVGHGYQGWKSTVVITAYGLTFGLFMALRRSVRAPMLAHAWTDLSAGF